MMSKQIFVTGASGNIGRSLVQFLLARGERIKAATRYPTEYPARPGVEPVVFDFDQPDTYATALRNTDRMVLMPRGLDLERCTTAMPLLEQAKVMGMQHVVLISGMGTEECVEFPDYYQLEQYLQASGLAYTILRPTWFMTLFIRGFFHPKERTRLCVPMGTSQFSIIDPFDIGKVAAVTLTESGHKNNVYTLTGHQCLNLHEYAVIMAKTVDSKIYYDPITETQQRVIYQRRGMSAEQIDYMMWFFAATRAGLYATVTTTVADLLGQPPTTLEQFATKHVQA